MTTNTQLPTINTHNCKNCISYGVINYHDTIIVPCSGCAQDRGWEWNGFSRCYGVNGISAQYKRGATLKEHVLSIFLLVRPRFIEDSSGLDGITVDEHLLNTMIPDEGKELYNKYLTQYLEGTPRAVFDDDGWIAGYI